MGWQDRSIAAEKIGENLNRLNNRSPNVQSLCGRKENSLPIYSANQYQIFQIPGMAIHHQSRQPEHHKRPSRHRDIKPSPACSVAMGKKPTRASVGDASWTERCSPFRWRWHRHYESDHVYFFLESHLNRALCFGLQISDDYVWLNVYTCRFQGSSEHIGSWSCICMHLLKINKAN